eukprot:5600284-Lingulodinium_polyedra.AAC.1
MPPVDRNMPCSEPQSFDFLPPSPVPKHKQAAKRVRHPWMDLRCQGLRRPGVQAQQGMHMCPADARLLGPRRDPGTRSHHKCL